MATVSNTDPLSNPDHADEHASLNLLAETLGDLLQGPSGLLNTAFSSFKDDAVTSPKLSTEIVNRLVPAGMIVGWPFNSGIPTGWIAMGTTVSNAQSLYPDLWSVAPTGWRSGSDLVLPNPDGRLLRGLSNQTPGTTGGTGDMTIPLSYGVPITANTVDQHTHTQSHDHNINSTSNDPYTGGRHSHGLNGSYHTHTYASRPVINSSYVVTPYAGNTWAGYRLTNRTDTTTSAGPFTTTTSSPSYTYGNTTVNMANTINDYSGNTTSSTEYVYYYDGLARTWNYLIIKAH